MGRLMVAGLAGAAMARGVLMIGFPGFLLDADRLNLAIVGRSNPAATSSRYRRARPGVPPAIRLRR
jgi:hypothetical protein